MEYIVEKLVLVMNLCPELSGSVYSTSPKLGPLITAAGKGAAWCLHSIILWIFKDVIALGKEATSAVSAGATASTGKRIREEDHSASSGPKAKRTKGRMSATQLEEEAAAESLAERIQETVDKLLVCRESLVSALTVWLKLAKNGEHNDVDRKLSVTAFTVISELRTFFPIRDSQYKSVDKLAFIPSHEVLNLLRGVFETEGLAVKTQLAGMEEESAGDAAKIANQLVLAVLLPLSRNLLFDVQNLNRRQAAAVLNYLLDPSETVQEAVKTVTRKLKESDIVKYLEIQMVLLKSVFGEHVVKAVKTRMAAEDNEDDGNFDLIQHAQVEAEGYTVVEDLARKLAQTLGVAKLRDEALVALENFFRVGLEYALSDMTQLGFTGVLSAYVRFLPPASLKNLAETIREHLEGNQALIDVVQESESNAFENLAVDKFTAFTHQIDGTRGVTGSKAKGKKRVDTSRVSPPAKVPATKSRTAAAAKATTVARAGATSKKAATTSTSKNNKPSAQPTRTSGRAKAVSYREDSDEDDDDNDDEEDDVEVDEESEVEEEVPVSQSRRNSSNRRAALNNSQDSRRSTASAVSSSSSSSGRRGSGRGNGKSSIASGLNLEDDDNEEAAKLLAELDAIRSKRKSR